jgi:cellulose synthase/poly-beta-1,6-N-acetylglucosamine synthase-like glycosyltransferase
MSVQIFFMLVFWIAVFALAYTYAGYPLLLLFISAVRSKPIAKGNYRPSITVIITAYNEERDLKAKIENTLSLNYDADQLEIIVASDCSTDRTDEIVQSFSARGVRLHRQTNRLGKTAAQNAAVELANGDIILFSDATTLYEPEVLNVIVPNFADPTVGCVAGKLIYVDPRKSGVGKAAQSYWRYETFLKTHESRVCSLIGASGCLYAVRRSAYVPLYNEACSDFIIATKMMEQGLRAVYEPAALCWEETNNEAEKELRMRVRVITQTYTDLWRHRHMMNPLRSGFYAVELISHKVLRYLVPVWLILLFVSSSVLSAGSFFFRLVLVAQIAFYLIAATGWFALKLGVKSGVVVFPQYFVLANWAALVAFYKFVRGERYARWEPIRETVSPLGTTATKTNSVTGN